MKGWSYCLRRIWRWVRIPLIIVALLPVLSAILFCVLIYMFPNRACGYSSRTISPKQGDFDAVVEGRCCDWGCDETLRLHRRSGWGSGTKIFVYRPIYADERLERPRTHEAVVVWSSANELEIAVDRLDRIHTQLEEAQGVRITYRIGFVDSQFAKPLALEGEKIIGMLKAKLTDAHDDWTIDDIVYLLNDMASRETYDVAGDEELMRLVDERVKGMKDPRIKEMTEKDVDLIREWSIRTRRLTVEDAGEHINRREMFSLLRSEGFTNALDTCVDFRPFGEIEVGNTRLKLFIYMHNPEHPGWKGTHFKELLIFSPAHFLGGYHLDQLPTGIKGNRVVFPGSEAEGNAIVFDSEALPKKIYLGGKVQFLSK